MLPLKLNTTTQQAHLDTGKLSLVSMSSDRKSQAASKGASSSSVRRDRKPCVSCLNYMELDWRGIDFSSDLTLMDMELTTT